MLHTHHQRSIRHLALSALFLICSLFLTACDGFNIYECNGKLLDAQTNRPASGARVLISPGPSPDWSHASLTDTNGTFHARFMTTTGWVFLLRPSPPKLQHLDLAYKTATSTGTITFDLTPDVQSKHPDSHTRIIDLPPATIPLPNP